MNFGKGKDKGKNEQGKTDEKGEVVQALESELEDNKNNPEETPPTFDTGNSPGKQSDDSGKGKTNKKEVGKGKTEDVELPDDTVLEEGKGKTDGVDELDSEGKVDDDDDDDDDQSDASVSSLNFDVDSVFDFNALRDSIPSYVSSAKQTNLRGAVDHLREEFALVLDNYKTAADILEANSAGDLTQKLEQFEKLRNISI